MEVKQASRADSFSWAFTGGAVIKDGTPTDTATVTVIAGAAGTDLIATATAHNAQGDSDPVDSDPVTVEELQPHDAVITIDPLTVSAAAGITSINYECKVEGDEGQINSYAWFVNGDMYSSMAGASGVVEVDFSTVTPDTTFTIQCKILYGAHGSLLESNTVDLEVTA